jgi:hypothetical protein
MNINVVADFVRRQSPLSTVEFPQLETGMIIVSVYTLKWSEPVDWIAVNGGGSGMGWFFADDYGNGSTHIGDLDAEAGSMKHDCIQLDITGHYDDRDPAFQDGEGVLDDHDIMLGF